MSKSKYSITETRLDKWLWAARLFKTRRLAAGAVSAGHIEVNGNRAKPARTIRAGDELCVRKGPYTYLLCVQQISATRGPAREARLLYIESEASIAERERLARELKTTAAQILYDSKRPSNRDIRTARTRKRGQP